MEISVLPVPIEEVLSLQVEEVQTPQMDEAFILPCRRPCSLTWRRFLYSNKGPCHTHLSTHVGSLCPHTLRGSTYPHKEGVSPCCSLLWSSVAMCWPHMKGVSLLPPMGRVPISSTEGFLIITHVRSLCYPHRVHPVPPRGGSLGPYTEKRVLGSSQKSLDSLQVATKVCPV